MPVADDEPALLNAIVMRLSKGQYKIRAFKSGDELCAAVEQDFPDLFLIDMKMSVFLLAILAGWGDCRWGRRVKQIEEKREPFNEGGGYNSGTDQAAASHQAVRSRVPGLGLDGPCNTVVPIAESLSLSVKRVSTYRAPILENTISNRPQP